jgi:uncharacterized protein (DUF2336 family)
MVRTKDVVLMATVSSFENIVQPGRHELKQFSELFAPVYRASSPEARRNAVAALSRCPTLPDAVARFIASQPIEIAALFLTRSPAIGDETLIAIARSHGAAHAKAIAARDNLSVKVVDALVSLHDGHASRRPAVAEVLAAAAPRTAPPAAIENTAVTATVSGEEALRQQLKSLIQRDTIARAEEDPDQRDATHDALLVRFARQRQARNFSRLLASVLGSSQWLTNRILIDVSGLQLATALVAMGMTEEDATFILRQFYPHLAAADGTGTAVDTLWRRLDAASCGDRLAAWIRADDYTQGKLDEAPPANANHSLPAARPVFGHARGQGRR